MVLIIAVSAVYLAKIYLPIKAKAMIIESIEASTGRKVTLGSVKLNILKGVVLEGLTIAADAPEAEPPFLKVSEISIGWLILPLIKQKQIVIPFVNIYSPEVNLNRLADKALNIPFLKQKEGETTRGFSFLIYRINIKNARINFSDEAVKPNYSQSVLLNIALSFSLPKSVKYSLSANLINPDKSPIILELKGDFDLSKKRLSSVAVKLENLNLTGIAAYYKDIPFSLKKGVLQKLDGDLIFKGELLKASFKAGLSDLAAEKDGLGIFGSATISGTASYDIKAKTFPDYSGNLVFDKISLFGLPYIKQAEGLSGRISFAADKAELFDFKANTLGSLFNLSGTIYDFSDPRINLRIATESVLLEKLEALLAENKIIKLPLSAAGPLKFDLNIDMRVKDAKSLRIEGQAVLNNDKVSLLDFNNEAVSAISGILTFSKDKIETANLKATVLGGGFVIAGSLSNFNAPQLTARINSESVALEKINGFLIKNKLTKLTVAPQGNAALALAVNMDVFAPETLKIKGEVALKDNKLSLPEIKDEISAISGKVNFDNNTVEWKAVTAEFKKIKYNSSGGISDFASPNIRLDLASDELKIKASGKLMGHTLTIKEFEGKYLNSEFDASGSAVLSEVTPQVDIDADIKFSLQDLKKIFSDYFPGYLAVLDKVNFNGFCDINLSAGGKLNDPKAMVLNAALESEAITVYIMGKQQLRFENFKLNMAQKNRRVSELRLTSAAYGGKIDLIAEADLAYPDPEFNLKFEAGNVDLAKLKLDTELKDKDISGLLSVSLNLKGYGFNTKSFLGKGLISVKEGDLWEFAPFKKLGQFLFIPSFEKIVFGEAEADLTIEDGGIFSDEAVLKSRQVNLFCYGKMDFRGNLDYIIKSEFNPEVARDSSSLMQILSSAIGKVNQFTTVKLTGTIEKPKLGIVPTAVETLKEIFN